MKHLRALTLSLAFLSGACAYAGKTISFAPEKPLTCLEEKADFQNNPLSPEQLYLCADKYVSEARFVYIKALGRIASQSTDFPREFSPLERRLMGDYCQQARVNLEMIAPGDKYFPNLEDHQFLLGEIQFLERKARWNENFY